MTDASVRAADALVAGLAAAGVDRVTCVAGESYLAVLDALRDSAVDVVTTRHEASAAFMALADAKLTGRPGVCLVNRGPGATNAAIALHSAEQDGSPLLLLVGHVPRPSLGLRAFQELDLERTLPGTSKGVWVVHDAERVAWTVAEALRTAAATTPGATVVGLPEDLLSARVPPPAPASARARPPLPDARDIAAGARLLEDSCRPLLLAGGSLDSAGGRAALRRCAERHHVPVVASSKRQDLLDNTHPLYAGHLHFATQPDQRALLARADLVLAVGTRLDQVTTGRGTFPRWPQPEQPLVHVHPDPLVPGRAARATLAVTCDATAFLDALAAEPSGTRSDRAAWAREVGAYEQRQAAWHGDDPDDGIAFGAVVDALGRRAADDAIVTVDAGNFTSWVHRHWRVRAGRLLAIASSAMGFGVPAGIAATLRHPDRQVLTFVGDGGMLMTGTELATAVQRRVPLRVIVANNGSYGTIRQHQELAFPGRAIATDLVNPDFAALARAFGAVGVRATRLDELEDALDTALSAPGPAVVDVHTSLDRISAYARLGGAHAGMPAQERTTAR